MAAPKTEFTEFIDSEVKKYEGVLVPVKAGFLERTLVKWVPIRKLHPNPDDEFCFPSIGPNYGIISNYEKTFRAGHSMRPNGDEEPLMVEKVHPDGYMILNGHHRWAAALRAGIKWAPVSIINLTQETDIENMLRNSEHDKRVTIDLDEAVFCNAGETDAEKPLHFPFNRIYKERIRLGVPSLLHYLGGQGYDIWAYTSGLYSLEYIRAYFKRYSVKLDGIITGTAVRTKRNAERKKKSEQLFAAKYKETIHIDNETLVRVLPETGAYEEFTLGSAPGDRLRDVADIIKGIKENEKI